ncbi:Penicillin-binding protein 2 [Anaerobiospirillum thomasii]|uniref:Peptidoglycan D,D-transpeptidase MrdA n=1 Tax=Anaerobiospirillum thomasii TaxID=179995 RepID=A0A2X0WMM0_9GAMM|nr:penicillin-binding protein 2 [Anaerobiospirillum thomasii]SPT69752.1 Penicillin-binding protein 2 [Anaerobiospirillum thomasii]SPT71697.1 Penicillin-binding protein 2 [Anaerobiospirillum thomasii]
MFGFKKNKKEKLIFSPKKHKRKHRSSGGIQVKNVELENSIFRNRIFIAIIFCVILAVILFSNLWYLQIVSHDDYQTRSNENRIRVLPVVPQRGIIYDRNHVVLAENRPVYHLVIFPSKKIDTRKSIEELNTLLKLNLTDKDVDNLVYLSKTRKRFTGIELSDLLTEKQIATFSVNRYRFPNVQVSANLKRFYPFANIATHAIGYVSRINQQDLEKLTEDNKIDNYEGSSAIGKLGIEKYYEDLLHGVTGSREVEVDSHGQVIRTLKYNPPKPGKDLVLSIDIRLQYYAQELLQNMKGAIVAVEPSSGEILAFYSNPSYDPNLFVRGIRNSEYQQLLNHPGKPLINRVTQGGYSPASTIKPLLAIMGLNEGLISKTSTYFGPAAFMLPGSTHRFRDWRASGHGWLDVYRAIEVSADTFFYDLAYRAGIDTIHDYLNRFGFGVATNIDIHEESLGINPSKEWKMRRFKQPWHIGDTVPIGIGQGYWTTTLLQLVKAQTTLANYGKIKTPHLLKAITDPQDNNKVIGTFKDPDEGKNFEVKDKDYFNVARAGMYLVINGPEGTGRRAFYGTKYKAAGKSGTAQVVSIKQGEKYNASALKVEHRDNALFVAFAPYYKPRILVGIILENEGGGSSKGAPLVRKVIDKYLTELYPGGYMGEAEGVKEKFGLGGTAIVQ